MLEAFQRIRATMPDALLIIAPRKPERFDEAERLARAAGLTRRPPHRAARRRRAARATSSSSTPSASWRSSIRWRRWCSSAAASSMLAATTSSSRRCSASRSSSARTCRTSPRSRGPFSTTAPPSRSRTSASSRPALLELLGDPVRRASLGAGGARAGRGQPRRPRPKPGGRSPSSCRASRSGVRRPVRGPHGSRRRCEARPVLERAVRRRGAPPPRTLRRAAPTSAAASAVRSSASATWRSAAAARRRWSPHLARLLLRRGERPAILSRGYAPDRAPPTASSSCRDAGGIRRRPGASRRRAADAGAAAARRAACWSAPTAIWPGAWPSISFGVTVHLLDDGFQHLQLERDVDLLLVGRDDVARPVTLPSGRLREPLDALRGRRRDAVAADPDVWIGCWPAHDMPLFRRQAQRWGRCVGLAEAGLAADVARAGCGRHCRPGALLRRSPAAGWHARRDRRLPRSPSLCAAGRRRRIAQAARGRRRGRRDDREGFRAAAAVPAVSDAGRVRRRLQWSRSRCPDSGSWLAGVAGRGP